MNNGKVSAQVVTSPPTWAARNGEFAFLNSAGAARVYYYANNQWNFVAGDTQGTVISTKSFTSSRDMTAASGNVSYTGVGFIPNVIIALSHLATSLSISVGFSDSSLLSTEIFLLGSTTATDAGSELNRIAVSAGVEQYSTISSYDTDGFTLTWTKAGLPTGTAGIRFLCIR